MSKPRRYRTPAAVLAALTEYDNAGHDWYSDSMSRRSTANEAAARCRRARRDLLRAIRSELESKP